MIVDYLKKIIFLIISKEQSKNAKLLAYPRRQFYFAILLQEVQFLNVVGAGIIF